MKKITSLMMMLVLCCVGAMAQGATEWADKLIRIGAAQSEMVPGKWYFLHNPRNPNSGATAFAMPGETIQSAGGLVTDVDGGLRLSESSVIDELQNEQGVSANNHMNRLVRFVAVDGVDGAYNIQFGNGNWIGNFPDAGDSFQLQTVSNTQYLGGLAGQYSFYLIKFNDAPNEAGRFGWNRYNMSARVDNNGAGNTVVFWASGESVADGNDLSADTDGDIKGNRVWQIYEVEDCGTEDPWESAINTLIDLMNSIGERQDYNYVDNLKAGENVGNSYGNYRTEDVEAFLVLQDKVEDIFTNVDGGAGPDYVKGLYDTVDDFKAFIEEYRAADEKVRTNKIPLAATDIAPGYYTLNSAMEFKETLKDTIYYTQQECNDLNDEAGLVEGDEGYLTTESIKEINSTEIPAPIKALRSKLGTTTAGETYPFLAWGSLEAKSDFLWKVEKAEGSDTKYRLVNMRQGYTFRNIATSTANGQLTDNDTSTVYFDYRGELEVPVTGETHVVYSIRSTYGSEGESGYHYLHCGGHNNGKGTGSWIVGWNGESGASQWYLSPVDDATADQWINGDAAKVRTMVENAEQIIATVPAQIEVAKDIVTTIYEQDSVVVTADQFYSQYTTTDEQTIPEGQTIYDFLIDGKQSTYWHSAWEAGDQPFKKHYLQINANETLNGLYAAKVTRRPVAGDHITSLAVKGYETEPTDETTFEEGKDLGTLSLPLGANNETIVSQVFDATGCNYLRFYSLSTSALSGGGSNRGYWHASEFNVFKADQSTRYAKTQYEVRAELINTLQAAIDAWNQAEYDPENGELFNDPEFQAAYTALVNANEAWQAVYVNPAALRDAVKAAPADKLFVTGNNPGQWQEGAATPAATVNAAQAYDETGAYTPAESEQWIKAIADATASAFAAANQVQTGKWYRIKFPTEEMYDNYEWSKTGAKNSFNEAANIDAYLELFGKTVAAAKGIIEYVPYTNASGNADTLATYRTQVAEELYDGNGLYFLDDDQMDDINNGEDLFRFIPATDTTYMIQNKATGLFLRGGQPASLSTIPTYFSTKALGAGTNLITYTNVFGEKVQHRNLHGQRSDNGLVCWEAATIGSNSALLIEEVEDVTEEPATTYNKQLWPGTVYTYTNPVDITIVGSEAVAYGAQLVFGDNDTTVVLKKIEAETIKAGTPYILIANADGEYKTPAERLKEIAAGICDAEGKYGKFEQQIAAAARDEEYVTVEMNHGMAVDTLQKGLGDLVGTFRSTTVEAGKGIVAKNNGFAHTIVNATVGAYSAYIKCDLDAESADVLGNLIVDFSGSIETGIGQVLDKVAKSGNIYTVDGKLVGKGNINAVNNMPAGIYIVNGVKVTKK